MESEVTQGVKHPDITVDWSNIDGNAFVLLGSVTRAMRRAGIPNSEIEAFRNEATSGNYDHLMQTCMRWVNITFGQEDNWDENEDEE